MNDIKLTVEEIKNYAIDCLGYSEEDFEENDRFWAETFLSPEEYKEAICYSR